ncbi:pore-forming ESAT-6 family protein [Paracoccus albus]|uniref:pore-forming ESAT-6 family protein n=1 Tax=Paracoccus albus TaxID=3017784 RepID=UPI0022EFDA63|nr:pore-forming ESAT-6 family protein [Paracoccus albus]WBU60262.1 pore-forming ESAT-6 family protein [Paracoccus albus]
MFKSTVIAFGLAMAASAATAQDAQDPDAAVSAARNQLGVLEYCQAEGHIDGNAVEIQGKMIEMLPAATDEDAAVAAYEKGKEGTVSAMGVEQTLAEAATAQSADEAALCAQLAQLVEQAGEQLPQ